MDFLLETCWYRSPINCLEKVKNITTYRLFNIFPQNVKKPIEKDVSNSETNRLFNIFKQNVKNPIEKESNDIETNRFSNSFKQNVEKEVKNIETHRPPPPMIQILEENVQIGKKNYYLNLKMNRCKK